MISYTYFHNAKLLIFNQITYTMKKLIVMMFAATMAVSFTACKSDEDKARETVEAYLYKNMKNPESLKILSCEVRLDTVPFYISDELLDMADKFDEAMDKYNRYKDRGYLWIDEKLESIQNLQSSKELLQSAYKAAQENDSTEIEYIAYVKSSGTNPMGGTVSSSTILILDKNNPEKILGSFIVDKDFIKQFVVLKMAGSNFEYEFKTNKFGKYITDGLPYFEQFIMNDAE